MRAISFRNQSGTVLYTMTGSNCLNEFRARDTETGFVGGILRETEFVDADR